VGQSDFGPISFTAFCDYFFWLKQSSREPKQVAEYALALQKVPAGKFFLVLLAYITKTISFAFKRYLILSEPWEKRYSKSSLKKPVGDR
jgi:hypothetical protein